MMNHALAAVQRGWAVFPVEPLGKEPLKANGFPIRWSEYATKDPLKVVDYWRFAPDANIGIACKPSELLVVDCDVPNGLYEFTDRVHTYQMWDALDTYAVRTGRGGWHFYYRWDNRVLASQASLVKGVLDIRCNGGREGGYVLAEGSRTEHGGYVREDGIQTLQDAPNALVRLVTDRPKPPRPVRSSHEIFQQPGDSSFRGLIEKVRYSMEGNRNATCHWAACCMRDDGATMEKAEEVLVEAGEAAGLTYAEIVATIRSAYRGR